MQDGFAEECNNLWDYCVAEGFNSVYPIGYPMSHSTKITLNFPPAWSFKFREWRGLSHLAACPVRKSRD